MATLPKNELTCPVCGGEIKADLNNEAGVSAALVVAENQLRVAHQQSRALAQAAAKDMVRAALE